MDAADWAGVWLGILALAATLSISISQMSLGVCVLFGAWLLRTGRASFGTGLGPVALAALIWAAAMVPLSTDSGQSLVYMRRWYLLAALWAGFLICRGEAARRRVYFLLMLGAVSLAMVGLAQATRWGLPDFNSVGQLVYRISLLQNYMTGGGLLMMAGLAALAGILALPRCRMRTGLMVALAPILFSLLLTMTRSAWLGFIAGAAVLLRLRFRRGLILLLVVAVALYALLPGVMKERLGSILDPEVSSNYQRIAMWEKGLELVGDSPLIGVGDRDLAGIRLEGWPAPLGWGHLHDNFLMFAVIWGVPGLLLASALLLRTGWLLLRGWRRVSRAGAAADPYRRVWTLAGAGVWSGFMVLGLFEWNFGDAEPALLLWLVTGIALRAGDRTDALDRDGSSS